MAHHFADSKPTAEELSIKSEETQSTQRRWTPVETMRLLECYSNRRDEYHNAEEVYQCILEDMKDLGVWNKPATVTDVSNKLQWMCKQYQNFVTANSAYDMPQMLRPLMGQLRVLYGTNEANEMSESNQEFKDKPTRRSWSRQETVALLDCIYERRAEIAASNGNVSVYAKIVEHLDRLKLLKMPLTARQIKRKMRVLEKAYGCTINSNLKEIPKCVRPFMKVLDSIYGGGKSSYQHSSEVMEAFDDDTMYDEQQSFDVHCKLSGSNRSADECVYVESSDDETTSVAQEISSMDVPAQRPITPTIISQTESSQNISNSNDAELAIYQRRSWTKKETLGLLKCFMLHRKDYDRGRGRAAVYQKMLDTLKRMNVLTKPINIANVRSKLKGMKNAYIRAHTLEEIPKCVRPFMKEMSKICRKDFVESQIVERCPEPTNNIFNHKLQEVIGQRNAPKAIPTLPAKESRVQEPTTRQHKSIPEESEMSGSETPLVKLEFIKLEPAAGTIICGEIHRCSETFVLSFVCTICREHHTNLAAYSSHLNNHFGLMSAEKYGEHGYNDDDVNANEQDLPQAMSENDQCDSELAKVEALPELKEIPSLLLENPLTSQPSDADVDSKNTNSFATQSLMSLLYNQPHQSYESTTLLKPIDGSELLPSDDSRIKSNLNVSKKFKKCRRMSTKTSALPVENATVKEVDFSCCNRCGQEFVSLSDYETHVKTEYAEDKMHICPYKARGKVNKRCSASNFPSNCLLTKHLLTIHGQYPKRFDCDFCKKSFKSPMSLQHHRTLHTGDRPYQCDICKKSFTLYHYLGIHMRFHSGEKPELCPACGRGFTTKSLLSLHMRTHNGDTKRYACSVCNQGFRFPRELAIHMRVHTGEKPFACKLCGKCYRSNQLVLQHERLHNPEKRHACRFCNLKFTQSSNRHLHERQKHNVATI